MEHCFDFCTADGDATFRGLVFPLRNCVAWVLEVFLQHFAFVCQVLREVQGPRASFHVECLSPPALVVGTRGAAFLRDPSPPAAAAWQRQASLPAPWAGRWGVSNPSYTKFIHWFHVGPWFCLVPAGH